jgi:alpha-beta hydrolase superfamily lysophospholipase
VRRSRNSVAVALEDSRTQMPPDTTTICVGSIREVACEDGQSLFYRLWPTVEAPVAALFLVSGMMSHSGWFGALASALSQSRIKVIGADRRSSGLNVSNRNDSPSRHRLIADLCSIIKNEDCGIPIYLVGWCWGAALAINTALELGGIVKGVILLAPGLFPSERISRAIAQDLKLLQDTQADSCLLKSPLTEEMFTNIIEFQTFIANDELAVRSYTSEFVRVSRQMSLVACTRLVRLTCPVLLLLAAQDQMVDNARTIRAFRSLPAEMLTCATINCNHGMQFEAPHELATHIAQWLDRSVDAPKTLRE